MEGGIFRITYWMGGLRDILEFLIFSQFVSLILLAGVIFLLTNKNKPISLPAINLISIKRAWIPVILSIALGTLVYNIPGENLLEQEKQQTFPSSKQQVLKRFTEPIDFLFINDIRIGDLYGQIEPTLRLKEKTVERSMLESRGLSGGSDTVLKGKYNETAQKKDTEQYAERIINSPLQVIELLNYYDQLGKLKEYETLELSSKKLVELDDFSSTARLYGISYNEPQFSIEHQRVLREALLEQEKIFKSLGDQILVRGEFGLFFYDNHVKLDHIYFEADDQNKILFSVAPIELGSTDIKSAVLKTKTSKNKTTKFKLKIFGKVVRVQLEADGIDILFEPYAIW